MDQTVYHVPALLPQVIKALDINPAGIYVDVTYGGGGHSQAILSHLSSGRLYAFDQDMQALERAPQDPRLILIHGNFRYMRNFLAYEGVQAGSVNGILGDLGVSFHHFDDPSRGFSFRWDGPLDMRMNQNSQRTASTFLAEASEAEIADVLYLYGELRNARRMASAIAKRRTQGNIYTVQQLLEVLKPYINPKQEKKELAQVFQALRIEINGELSALRSLLEQSVEMLASGGRLAIITYHSLEDRMVKNFMKTGNCEGKEDKDLFGRSNTALKMLGSKPIVPDEKEILENPRSRSAKLRVAVKI